MTIFDKDAPKLLERSFEKGYYNIRYYYGDNILMFRYPNTFNFSQITVEPMDSEMDVVNECNRLISEFKDHQNILDSD